jgi:hypothetical protein
MVGRLAVGVAFALAVAFAACGEPERVEGAPVDAAPEGTRDAAKGRDARLFDAEDGAARDSAAPVVDRDAGTTLDAASSDAGATAGSDAGSDAGALRVAVLSDLNGSYGSTTYESTVHQAVAALRTTVRPDLVLVAGDMVAGQQAGLDYPAMWAAFHAAVTTPLLAAGIPVAPAPGNHDASAYAGFAAERAEYARQWEPQRRPAVQMLDGAQFPFRYSFALRGALFVALDATTVGPLAAAQRAWVAGELARGSAYPVKIVYGHVPIHPTTVGRETQVLDDGALEDVLRTHGALFVGGHHHGYYPGVSGGVRQVVTPCIGGGPRALIGTSAASPRGFVVIEIAGGRVTAIEARTGAGFTSRVLRSGLPPELRYGAHVLTRDDRAGF